MRIEERIGARLREAREAKGWSQEVLGGQMTRYGRDPWSPQTVSVAESGGRDFKAEDMLVLALVFKRPVAWFYQPNLKAIEEIKLQSGFWIKEKEMRQVYGLPKAEAYRLARELEQLAAEVALLGEGEA